MGLTPGGFIAQMEMEIQEDMNAQSIYNYGDTGDECDDTFFAEQMSALNDIENEEGEFNHLADLRGLFNLPSASPVPVGPSHVCHLDANDLKAIEVYLEDACKIGFLLSYPPSQGRMTFAELRNLIQPLLQGTHMNKVLICNILLALLPGSDILGLYLEEWGPHLDQWTSQLNEKDAEDEFLITLETSPSLLLILADRRQRRVIHFGGKLPLTAAFEDMFLKHGLWFETIDKPQSQPELEDTLNLVYTAMHLTVDSFSFTSIQDLIMTLIKALLIPYENQRRTVLQKLGITGGPTARQPQLQGRAAISPRNMPALEQIPELYNAKIRSLPLGGRKTLRMLQCIKEIGCVTILETLKVAAAQPMELLPTSGPQHLLQIHRYLDTKSVSSHLDVARMRYVKLCYFNAFQSEVQTLTAMKKQSRINRKQGKKRVCLSVDDTPETEWINSTYPNIDHGSHPSAWIVRRAIIQGIEERYGGRSEGIEEDLRRYLTEGAALNYVLHNLNPALLVLFPGDQHGPPCLAYDSLEDASLRAKLRKPINTRDFDTMTDKEAKWFQQALRTLRPELYAPRAINTAIYLLGLPSDAEGNLRCRDPGSTEPLDFLA
ncbi:hypothetical protein DPSP01_014419 [Paraphaeosphaeria sporulosa]